MSPRWQLSAPAREGGTCPSLLAVQGRSWRASRRGTTLGRTMLKKLLGLFGRGRPEFALPGEAELTTTASGLGYVLLEEGSGRAPGPRDTVTVRYAGWLLDGRLFDASYPRSISFALDRVIPGWTEGLQLLREGGRAKLLIPPELAYGPRGAPPAIGPNATLLFQVELLAVR